MAGALEGIKVADFTWVVAGALLTRCLADYGATVIKVESHTYPDLIRTQAPFKDGIPGLNRGGLFANVNANKYGTSLNLNHPKGLEIAKRLIALSDVVAENFTPGRMGKWGLGYDDLVKIKPDIIMVSLSVQGQTGPHASQPGFAYMTEGLAGFYNLQGWSDRMPSLSNGMYGDTLAPILALSAVMAALDYRRRTGKGQYLDIAQLESSSYFISPLLLDYFSSGRGASRMGNHHNWIAPHGVYPCRGQDRWCALSVSTDEEWQALCRAMGNPQWTSGPRFATPLKRKENEEELDRFISSWTADFDPYELTDLLQREGGPAGAVLTGKDLASDPQFQHRGAQWPLEHTEIGHYTCDTLPYNLSATPARPTRPAPCLGEHNEYICTKVLGMSSEEFNELSKEGVFD